MKRAKGTAAAATAAAAPKDVITAASNMPEIKDGQSVALLQELHILTRDGKMNQDSRRKLKQVYHLTQFIEPLLRELRGDHPEVAKPLSLVDHGAGKSYLGFILYDLFFKNGNDGRTSTASRRAKSWCSVRKSWRRNSSSPACRFYRCPWPNRRSRACCHNRSTSLRPCMRATRLPMTPFTSP